MSNKSGCFFPKSQQGITLIEMVVVIVILGIAASIVVAAMSALSGVGWERKTTDHAQLAQQRMELILNEKRKVGFPANDVFCQNGTEAKGPDPCCLYNLSADDLPGCKDFITVEFNNNDESICLDNNFTNCTVNVIINDDQTFTMLLFNY